MNDKFLQISWQELIYKIFNSYILVKFARIKYIKLRNKKDRLKRLDLLI